MPDLVTNLRRASLVGDRDEGTSEPGGAPAPPTVDSEFRFFAVFWFSAGALIYWLIPRIEREQGALRALACVIFLGGCARTLSALVVGLPHPLIAAFIPVELIGPPVLVIWQAAVARRR